MRGGTVVFPKNAKRAAIALLFVCLTLVGSQSVLAPPSYGGMPMPLSQYGVVRIYASQTFTGNARITIVSDSVAPFFVERLLLILNRAADFDILLDSINIDGTGTIQVSNYPGVPRVVLVSAGSMIGEVISSLPSSLQFLLSKDPLGNDAISVSGIQGNGLTVGLKFVTGAYNLGTTISTIALITAPTNSTVTITIS